MDFFKSSLLAFVAFLVGIFAFSNIFLTLFYTIPRLKKEKRNGNLKKPIPVFLLAMPILFWLAVISYGLYFSNKNLSQYIIPIYVGLVLGIAFLMKKDDKKKRDIEDDFNRVYRDYLIDENK